MNFYTDDHPIIACSTGTQSNTAIAVIRLSGFAKLSDIQKFFSLNLLKLESRRATLTNIKFNDKVFDNGLVLFFPEGQSYTGENVLELNVHGNQLNIQNILNIFINEGGFRPAHPGELTYRALKNKKLSLSQVEGLDMLLNANSSLMLSQGLDVLQGDLHARYLALHDAFIKLKSAVEISIDFSEDVGVEETQKLFNQSFDKFKDIISSLKTRTEGNLSSLLAPEIALTGQTNAGKSSLFNILLKDDRSIVSNIAGTTRDYVSEILHIDGTNYKLVDTAGIRESSDVIENIGIERALTILKRSFFKILIINPFETNPEYLKKFHEITFDMVIFSHKDQPNFASRVAEIDCSFIGTNAIFAADFMNGPIEPLSKNIGPIEPLSENIGPIEPLAKNIGPIEPLSQKSGPIEPLSEKSGPIEPLSEKSGPIVPLQKTAPIEPVIRDLVTQKYNKLTSNNPILLERHRSCINKIYSKTLDLSCNINDLDDVAILSSEVNILGNHLAELIGIVSPDDVLNSIFSNFCIGK
jgi:tRNA modification GTPase